VSNEKHNRSQDDLTDSEVIDAASKAVGSDVALARRIGVTKSALSHVRSGRNSLQPERRVYLLRLVADPTTEEAPPVLRRGRPASSSPNKVSLYLSKSEEGVMRARSKASGMKVNAFLARCIANYLTKLPAKPMRAVRGAEQAVIPGSPVNVDFRNVEVRATGAGMPDLLRQLDELVGVDHRSAHLREAVLAALKRAK
jgi:hypothetical protein